MFGRDKKQCKDCNKKFRKKDIVQEEYRGVHVFRCVKCNTRYHEELEENRKRFEKEQAEKKINDKINTIVESYEESYGVKNEQLSKLYEKRHEIIDEQIKGNHDYDAKIEQMEDEMMPHEYYSKTAENKREKLFDAYQSRHYKYIKSLEENTLKILDELELILNKKFCRECCTLHSGSCENS